MEKRFKVTVTGHEKVLKKEKILIHLRWLLRCVSAYVMLNSLPQKII